MHINIRFKRFVFLIFVTVLFLSIHGPLQSQVWKRDIKKDHPTFKEIQEQFYKHWQGREMKHKGGWKQFKRWEWLAETRLNKDGYLDPTLNWQGWLEKQTFFGDHNRAAAAAWTEIGPIQKPEQYNTAGYAGLGRLNCITFHPNNSDIIWVGSPSGGLWKTTDGGNSWFGLTDELPNLGVSSILVHPDNPNIIYIATGDGDGYDTFSVGVLKSTDGGVTWNSTGLSPLVSDRWAINKLVMHPNDPETIIAATRIGIYKTTNGGDVWISKLSGDFKDLEVQPRYPENWIASESGIGVYKSTDYGESWAKIENGLPSIGFGRIALEYSTNPSNIVYALYVNLEDGFFGFYRSDDHGNSWHQRSNSPNLLGWSYLGLGNDGQGYYDLALGVHPEKPNTIYVGGVNMWRSQDGGTSWEMINHWAGQGNFPLVHADHHDLVFHPNDPDTIFSGNDGGIYKSTDGGDSWTDISSGLAIHQIYRLGVSAQDPNLMIIGNQDNGSDLFKDGTWKSVNGGDGMECAIDPADSKVMYSSYYFGNFQQSKDSGLNWLTIGREFADTGAWVTPFILNPNDSSIIHVATTKVYKSTDQGETFVELSHDLNGEPMISMAVAPSDNNYIYTADSYRFFVTTDGGTQWHERTRPLNAPYITGMTVHPQNPRTLWVTIGGYEGSLKVFQSRDAGETWFNVSGKLPNIPANCIAIDPISLGLYVGTDLGVFYSLSENIFWQAFDNGLPNVIINDIEISPQSGLIHVATYGRGVWRSPLADAPNVYPPSNLAGERRENRSFFSLEYLDELTWTHNSANDGKQIVNYRIYRLIGEQSELIATIDANVNQYYVRKVENMTNNYCMTSVDADGNESLKACISVD
jgi:photosystem II stability/assembly factor-like uncharacterized protein